MRFKMTKERSDVINELLKTNGEALTAFHDEGMRYGMYQGFWAGTMVTLATIFIFASIIHHRNESKNEEES